MTEKDFSFNELPYAVMGSASVPMFFPPTPFKGHLLMDGMTAYNTDVEVAIERCKEIVGRNEENITVDLLQIGDPPSITEWDRPAQTAFYNYERQ